jgi:hypothetical protein
MFLGIPWAQELKKEVSTVNAGRPLAARMEGARDLFPF